MPQQVGNALDFDLSQATAFFLYLIDRGYKIILPVLQDLPRPVRVATYMQGLPGIAPLEKRRVTPDHQPLAA